MDDLGDLELLLILGIIGFGAYEIYKFFNGPKSGGSNPQTPAQTLLYGPCAQTAPPCKGIQNCFGADICYIIKEGATEASTFLCYLSGGTMAENNETFCAFSNSNQ